MGIDEWEPRLGIFTIRGLAPANDNLMSQGDDSGSSEALLPIRNESRETRADRIVIICPGIGMAVALENLQLFSTVHSFERGRHSTSRPVGQRFLGYCRPLLHTFTL
jgi:hypothetical protein